MDSVGSGSTGTWNVLSDLLVTFGLWCFFLFLMRIFLRRADGGGREVPGTNCKMARTRVSTKHNSSDISEMSFNPVRRPTFYLHDTR